MVNCLVRTAEESIYGFPVWPLQDGETYCMPGYHGASVMAEACAKKIPGIDWKRAYAAMRKRNMEDDYMGLPYFRKMGYIPADKEDESVGKFVEYIYCEWACANVAQATGNAEDARIQRQRSQNYRNFFDPRSVPAPEAEQRRMGSQLRSARHGTCPPPSRLHRSQRVAVYIFYPARREGIHAAVRRARSLREKAGCALHC